MSYDLDALEALANQQAMSFTEAEVVCAALPAMIADLRHLANLCGELGVGIGNAARPESSAEQVKKLVRENMDFRWQTKELAEEVHRLGEENDKMREMLRNLQYSASCQDDDYNFCAVCQCPKSHGCAADCALDALLQDNPRNSPAAHGRDGGGVMRKKKRSKGGKRVVRERRERMERMYSDRRVYARSAPDDFIGVFAHMTKAGEVKRLNYIQEDGQ